jgi:hypothetical protein
LYDIFKPSEKPSKIAPLEFNEQVLTPIYDSITGKDSVNLDKIYATKLKEWHKQSSESLAINEKMAGYVYQVKKTTLKILKQMLLNYETLVAARPGVLPQAEKKDI